jgi:hypothetical protein
VLRRRYLCHCKRVMPPLRQRLPAVRLVAPAYVRWHACNALAHPVHPGSGPLPRRRPHGWLPVVVGLLAAWTSPKSLPSLHTVLLSMPLQGDDGHWLKPKGKPSVQSASICVGTWSGSYVERRLLHAVTLCLWVLSCSGVLFKFTVGLCLRVQVCLMFCGSSSSRCSGTR